jgi:DNA oxidative demethylase
MTSLPLFDEPAVEPLGEGAVLLRGAARDGAGVLLDDLHTVLASAGWRHLVTPGGQRMSVAMTNAGALGWLSDRRGYRYDALDPLTGRAWPPTPASFLHLARDCASRAGYPGFDPDACLINRYAPGARLSLHQDRDELDFSQPIVSVSLGLPAVFLFGGLQRADKPRRIALRHGDVAVWGGASRLAFHGVAPLRDGLHPLTGACRINVTFRTVRRAAPP